jgi:hypothetical protein
MARSLITNYCLDPHADPLTQLSGDLRHKIAGVEWLCHVVINADFKRSSFGSIVSHTGQINDRKDIHFRPRQFRQTDIT